MIFNFSPSHIIGASMLDRDFDYVVDYLIAKSITYLETNLGLTIDDDLFYEVRQIENIKDAEHFDLSNVIDLVKAIELYLESIEEGEPKKVANQTFKIIGLALLSNGFTEERNYELQMLELNAKEEARVQNIKDTKAKEVSDTQQNIFDLYNNLRANGRAHRDCSSVIMQRLNVARSTVTRAYEKFDLK